MDEAVHDHAGEVALRGEPEAALAVGRDAFQVEKLGGRTAAGDAGRLHDARRLLLRIDGEDGRLHRVDAAIDRIEDVRAARIGRPAGERAAAERSAAVVAARADKGTT